MTTKQPRQQSSPQQPPQQPQQPSTPPRGRIFFKPEHLDEARQRRTLIEETLKEAQELEERARRAKLIASIQQEAFTAWLAREYRLHPERGEQWHLDIDHLQLLRLFPPETPDSPDVSGEERV